MTGLTRIVANTLASYIRLVALGLTGLLTTPIALRVLGVTDYGIFAVIGGSLTLLMFVNVALTGGAQRHIAYSLGEGNPDDARKWLTSSILIHSVLAVALAAVALLSCRWALVELLALPAARLAAATWLYRMVVVALVCNICSAPYQAFLMAHEEILSLSLMSIFSCIALLGGTLRLQYLKGDLLVWYGGIYAFSQVILFAGPVVYCSVRFRQSCRLNRKGVARLYVTELLSFSSWNLFGALSGMVRSQGPAILFSRFFGAPANAAYGIALQASGAATNISSGVLRATTPQIVKRQASGDQAGMAVLSNLSNLYSFGILWVVIAPVLLEIQFCLGAWLHKVPDNAPAFVDLLLIALLLDQLTLGFSASVQATGRIAGYQIVVGFMNCLAIPVGYFCLHLGMPATSVLWVGVATAVMATVSRIWFARSQANIPVGDWLRTVLAPSAICVFASILAPLPLMRFLQPGKARFLAVLLVSSSISSFVLWRFGTAPNHRKKLRALAFVLLRRSAQAVRYLPVDVTEAGRL